MRFTVQTRLNEYVKQTINNAAVGESPTAALYTVFSFYTEFSAYYIYGLAEYSLPTALRV